MHIIRLNSALSGAMMLMAIISSCSTKDSEDWLITDTVGPMVTVEFDATFDEMGGTADVFETSDHDMFRVYGFNSALGLSAFGNTNSLDAQWAEVTRNSEDSSRWDYVDSQTGQMLQWNRLLKYPISFYATSGAGISMSSFITEKKLPVMKVEMPVREDGTISSRDTHDLLFASALRLNPSEYYEDSTKVSLVFKHILPLVNLQASLAEANDLEVTVQSATLMGLAPASKYNFNEVKPQWQRCATEAGIENADIVMTLKNPVTLGNEGASLQDYGAYIIPQSVRAWTSAARKDGAGIKLMARVFSKALKTYLVGSETGFGQVYVPIDDMTFVSNKSYTFTISFTSIYNEDGSIGYRASWKPVVTPWEEKDENLVYE